MEKHTSASFVNASITASNTGFLMDSEKIKVYSYYKISILFFAADIKRFVIPYGNLNFTM